MKETMAEESGQEDVMMINADPDEIDAFLGEEDLQGVAKAFSTEKNSSPRDTEKIQMIDKNEVDKAGLMYEVR